MINPAKYYLLISRLLENTIFEMMFGVALMDVACVKGITGLWIL